MPYPGVPKNKEKQMERCVERVMNEQGKDKSSAIAICFNSIVDSKKMEFNMDKTSLYIPFTKKDEDQRMVWGYASTESLDSQGEIVSKNAIVKALPDYMKFGNIREMHQPIAVGKTQTASVDQNGLYIGVKVVDNNAWTKVKEGVYNGFSIGGSIVTKIGNEITNLKLTEISIVDRPANPDALFTVIKAENLLDVTKEDMGMVGMYGSTEEESEDSEEDKWDRYEDFMEGQVTVFEAHDILCLVRELIYMIASRIMEGKDISDLEDAAEKLKSVVRQTLSDGIEMSEKIDGLISMVKSHRDLTEADYAYVSSDGKRFLPFTTEDFVKNSINTFSTVVFESDNHKILAAKILKSAAEKLNVPVKNTFLLIESEKMMDIDVQKGYAPSQAKDSYFAVMQKAIG